ncbi:beta-1,3-glucan-binding protein-like [Lycorma delicatula]|uniref:beta-1,3-glucan-binding protein-like n=1 Tax=Lycorma delicatula TaxID=130591 RepID=UPI003F51211C
MHPLMLNFILFFMICFVTAEEPYKVPPALIEVLDPKGLRVSIPDHEGITLFAFHGNVNEDFEMGREAGQMAQDVLRKKNGRWTYINRDIRLKNGDILYYWLYVIKDGLGYERLFQSYTVGSDTIVFKVDTNIPPDTPTPPGTPAPPDTPTPPEAPKPIDPPVKACEKSETIMNGKNQCRGSLIFHSQFTQSISKDWSHIVQIGGDYEDEFVVFDSNLTNSFIKSNCLVIKPTLLDDEHGKDFSLSGPLDLSSRCTSSTPCFMKRTVGKNILPPVVSGRLSTQNSFSFLYGVVEVKAKLPHGDWVVPEIWLLSKSLHFNKDKSAKIIIASSIGNDQLTFNSKEIGNKRLFCGLEVGSLKNYFEENKNSGYWSDQFHIFKMVWSPDQFIFYVDNKEIKRWNSRTDPPFISDSPDKNAPFNHEHFIMIGLHVGGLEDFPDGITNNGAAKPWRNDQTDRKLNFYRDTVNWHRTWNEETKLQIEYIKVWAI